MGERVVAVEDGPRTAADRNSGRSGEDETDHFFAMPYPRVVSKCVELPAVHRRRGVVRTQPGKVPHPERAVEFNGIKRD